MYKGTPLRDAADFLAETLNARRKWHNIFKALKKKNKNEKQLPPRIPYPAKLSFRIGDKECSRQKLQKFVTTRLTLQEMLKRLKAEMKMW